LVVDGKARGGRSVEGTRRTAGGDESELDS